MLRFDLGARDHAPTLTTFHAGAARREHTSPLAPVNWAAHVSARAGRIRRHARACPHCHAHAAFVASACLSWACPGCRVPHVAPALVAPVAPGLALDAATRAALRGPQPRYAPRGGLAMERGRPHFTGTLTVGALSASLAEALRDVGAAWTAEAIADAEDRALDEPDDAESDMRRTLESRAVPAVRARFVAGVTYKPAALARAFGVSTKTVARWAQDGVIRARFVRGRAVRASYAKGWHARFDGADVVRAMDAVAVSARLRDEDRASLEALGGRAGVLAAERWFNRNAARLRGLRPSNDDAALEEAS